MFIQSLSRLTLWRYIRLVCQTFHRRALEWYSRPCLALGHPASYLSLMYTSSPLPQSWFPPLRTVFLLPPQKRNLLSVCTWFRSGCFQWKSPLTAHRGHQYEVGGCRERVKIAQCYNLFRHWTGPGLKYSSSLRKKKAFRHFMKPWSLDIYI